MKERDRVLELVKKGVISTDEAIILLENMAEEKDNSSIVNEKNTTGDNSKIDEINLESSTDEKQDHQSEDSEFNKKEDDDNSHFEKILEGLAEDANKTSAELDALNAELDLLREEVKIRQERLTVLDTMEDLDTLSTEDIEERTVLKGEIEEREGKISTILTDRILLEEKLRGIKKDKWDTKAESFTSSFDIPDDWVETATDKFNQMGEKMGSAGVQLGDFLRKTAKTVVDSVNDNVDWKNINVKVPGVASTKFEHTFVYNDCTATILDFKIANGKVKLQSWDSSDIKIESSIKLYGKMEEETPLESFDARSTIEVTDESLIFQVPNKRVRIDMVIYLPLRVYDHVSLKLLNGEIVINSIETKDIYTKTTNGNMTFDNLTATMLEVEGVNGEVTVNNGNVSDFMSETVNGDVRINGGTRNISLSLVNGTVRITSDSELTEKINVTSVNGAVKVSLPEKVGLEGTAKTNVGSIKERLGKFETIREKKGKTNHLLQFRRINDEKTIQVDITSTTGSIFLKNNE